MPKDEVVSLSKKVPPHNIDAERSVLGAILIDQSAVSTVAEIVTAEHFYLDEHRRIFSSMLLLFEKHQPVDLVTLTAELKKNGDIKSVGGAAYLSQLIDATPTSAYVEHYANIVKADYTKRRMIALASRLVQRAF